MDNFCILGGKIKHSGEEPLAKERLKVVCVVCCDVQTHRVLKSWGSLLLEGGGA